MIVDDELRSEWPSPHTFQGFEIEKHATERMIWITPADDVVSQIAQVYYDGSVAYDKPEEVPLKIMKHIRKLAKEWF